MKRGRRVFLVEKQTKWYIKILLFLIIIVLSPIIIFFFLCGGIVMLIEWLKTPLYKKQYQKSAYYQDMKIPYRSFVLNAPSFLFYNAAREQHIPLKLIHQETSNFDYIIYQEAIYFLPLFDQMAYNNEKQQWEVDCDGEWFLFDEEMDKQIALLNDNHLNLPVYLLLSESELAPREIFDNSLEEIIDGDYAKELLPTCIKIRDNYLSALVGKPMEGF